MSDINMFTCTGRLTKDADRKTISTGTDLVVFDIANNTGYGDYKKTIFLTVNMWGKSGQGVFPYLKKGAFVGVAGKLEVQEWSDHDGNKHRKNVINCNSLSLFPSGNKQEQDSAPEFDPSDVPF
jgi:single-strand DNA-binding protein